MLCSVINQHTYRQKLHILISKICLFSILILICYIFFTNKVLEIRLVVLIPLTTVPRFNWQLCLNLTDPNFAWFNSHSTKKVPTLGLASSYLRTSILSVFYEWRTHYKIVLISESFISKPNSYVISASMLWLYLDIHAWSWIK